VTFPCAPAFARVLAARQAAMGDALDWRECARRLRAAGHDDAAIRLALEDVA
jgi:hypothetical protein